MSLFFLIPDNVNQTLLSFASQTVILPSLKPPNNSILNKQINKQAFLKLCTFYTNTFDISKAFTPTKN